MAYKGEIKVNRSPESWDNIPDKLTTEQEASRDATYDRWYKFLTETTDVDTVALEEELAWLYSWDNMPPPDVLVCDSPLAVVQEARKYDPKIQSTQWIGLSWDAPRAAFYEAHNAMLGADGKPLLHHDVMDHVLRMSKAGAWDGILFDGETATETGLVIVSRRPTLLKHDDQFRPHAVDGPCAMWADGYKLYAYHGVEMEERHIERPNELTREELLTERNSERARAVAEILGWEKFLEKAGTKLISKQTAEAVSATGIPETLTYELFAIDAPQGRWEMAPKFLRMQSPVLVDGGSPFYLEPVHPELTSALAARKWQIPKGIWPELTWYDPEECNADPTLDYLAEA